MKVQISSKRIIPDAVTVWNEAGPEVDVVMDLKNLGFREGTIEEMYVFHVLERFFLSEIPVALENWRKCLMPGKEVYIVSDDFEFLCRSFVGSELNVDDFNKNFSYPTKITRDNLLRYLKEIGFSDTQIRIWYVDVPNLLLKKDFELIISARK